MLRRSSSVRFSPSLAQHPRKVLNLFQSAPNRGSSSHPLLARLPPQAITAPKAAPPALVRCSRLLLSPALALAQRLDARPPSHHPEIPARSPPDGAPFGSTHAIGSIVFLRPGRRGWQTSASAWRFSSASVRVVDCPRAGVDTPRPRRHLRHTNPISRHWTTAASNEDGVCPDRLGHRSAHAWHPRLGRLLCPGPRHRSGVRFVTGKRSS